MPNIYLYLHVTSTLKQISNYAMYFLGVVPLVLPICTILKAPNLTHQPVHLNNCFQILIYIAKSTTIIRHRRFCKDQASITPLTPSQDAFLISNGDKELGLSASTFAPPESAANPTLGSISAILQVPKYTKNDLQRIFKVVLDVKPFATRKNFNKSQERILKPWALDVYMNKFHIDCYNFIQQCENYFANSGSKGHNQVPFVTIFFKEKALNWWQQYK